MRGGGGGVGGERGYVCPEFEFQIRLFRILRSRPCPCRYLQYRSWALQHLHMRKLRAIWRISMKSPRKKLTCKFLRELLYANFLHSNLSVFLR